MSFDKPNISPSFINKIAITVAIAINCVFFAPAYVGDRFDAPTAAQLGDFIGGYIGTIISLGTLWLIALTYLESKIDISKKSFEDKFFQYLSIIEESVNNAQLDKEIGKKAYSQMYVEWITIVRRIEHINNTRKLNLNKNEISKASYVIMYRGLYVMEDKSERVIEFLSSSQKKEIFNELKNHGYSGNQSYLSSFYRQIYQIVIFLDREKSLSDDDRKFYRRVIRSCLTTQQQCLLALNILVGYGTPWKTNNLLQQYNPLKNIPENYMFKQIGSSIKDLFPELKFEYEEQKSPI